MLQLQGKSEARLLNQLFGPVSDQGTIALTAVRGRGRRQLTRLEHLVREELSERGIGLTPSICLVSAPSGEILLAKHHPQQAEIETWLSNNPKLNKKFKEVEVIFQVVHAAEQADRISDEVTCFTVMFTEGGSLAFFDADSCPQTAG